MSIEEKRAHLASLVAEIEKLEGKPRPKEMGPIAYAMVLKLEGEIRGKERELET